MKRIAAPFTFILSIIIASVCAAQTKKSTPVFVTEIKLAPFVNEIEALGTLKANEYVALTSSVTELVTRINFNDGDRVKKGSLLVQMDATSERALLAEEASRKAEAERQVDRLAPLVKSGAASSAALDTLQRELLTSQARSLALESQLLQRQIIAPFDGVLGQRNISVGALLQPGIVITTIDDDSHMRLDFMVPELFLSQLANGNVVTATTGAWPTMVFEGSISNINSRINPITRTVAVRATLPNPDRLLRPGMLMRVELQSAPRDAMVLPEEAVVVRGNENSVLRVVINAQGQAVAERAVIELGTRRKGEVEVLSGLELGDKVITHGTNRVRPGSTVTVAAIETNNESLEALLQQRKDTK